MLWTISCVDKPDTAAIRDSVLQPHRDYLGSQKGIPGASSRRVKR